MRSYYLLVLFLSISFSVLGQKLPTLPVAAAPVTSKSGSTAVKRRAAPKPKPAPVKATKSEDVEVEIPSDEPRYSYQFFDDFMEESDLWCYGNSSTGSSGIVNGKLEITGSSENSISTACYPAFAIDVRKNWTVSVTTKNLGQNLSWGIYFGSHEEGINHRFTISSDKKYNITTYPESGDYPEINGESSAIQTAKENVLGISYLQGSLKFYINGTVVETINNPITAQGFGMFVLGEGKVIFDNFELKGFPGKIKAFVAETPTISEGTAAAETSSEMDSTSSAEVLPAAPQPKMLDIFDKFNADPNPWPKSETNVYSIVPENEKYTISTKDGVRVSVLPAFNIDPQLDWTCSALATWVKGNPKRAYGIEFASSDERTHRFGINADGNYSWNIYNKTTNLWEPKTEWTANENIRKSGSNILKIEKRDDKITFFVNEIALQTLYFSVPFGNHFGVVSEGNQTIDFQYFRLNGTQPVEEVQPTPAVVLTSYYEVPFSMSDDFSGTHKWCEENTPQSMQFIAEGSFSIFSKDASDHICAQAFTINPNKNWISSVETTWMMGEEDQAYGLQFASGSQGKYMLNIGAYGFYEVSYYNAAKNTWTSLVDWTESEHIVKKGKNELRVEKNGEFLKIYINSHFLNTIPVQATIGNGFGLFASGKQQIIFDNFNLLGFEPTAVDSLRLDQTGSSLIINSTFEEAGIWASQNDITCFKGVESGIYRIDSKEAEKGTFSTIDANIKTNEDWTSSVLTTWNSGKEDQLYGLIFSEGTGGKYYFAITAGGLLDISRFNKVTEQWEPIKEGEISAINKRSSNILKAKFEGGSLRFYINDELIETTSFTGGFGSTFGMEVDDIQSVSFDNFRIEGTLK